ncbi:hypothetical protein ACX27_27410 [Nostoc piscinale CENA21]|uniref:Uncharacterized protein n=1 Tax=Nostoc piscinale CENA21 TaxID=224013 RepID=A0A0M4TP92_9NOSO|nr:hypothetical protein [Nostoc piscinale]ALF55736.1 hypothetical protein ACX27_27410 [Nostoc piscinale CENA21]
MTDFSTRDRNINQKFFALSAESKELRENLKLMRDSKLYLEKGYFTFQDYCDAELARFGGYSRVERLLGQEGGV